MLMSSSGHAQQLSANVEQLAQQYFTLYTKREDFDSFMAFYDDNVVLEDIVYGNHIADKKALRRFFNWTDPKFSMISEHNLVLEKMIVDRYEVVATGYFPVFNYDDKPLGPWRFIIHLTFNEQGKIIHQVDWINYTPRSQFLGGDNLNKLIN